MDKKNKINQKEVGKGGASYKSDIMPRVQKDLINAVNSNSGTEDMLTKNHLIIKKIFPQSGISIQEILEKYKKRDLPASAIVSRVAPSPTGFMHIGNLYVALISEKLAHQSNGVFFLRIEDTDKKREIDGASDLIINTLHKYSINEDEGIGTSGKESGEYGPYKQSERSEIYRAFIIDLLEKGEAYPCFCSDTELDEIRKQQEEQKMKTGYYGKWAKWRNATQDAILKELENETPFVIRYKSSGDIDKKLIVNDIIKGNVQFPENDLDIVIMKQDGLPTYHFAHVVDDHLMGTTHVIRGDEWLPSTPLHMQLFKTMEWEAPIYAHMPPIQKIDDGNKRKLSKRKDPEASVLYYDEKGYPKEAILEYLLNLANPNFEDWRKANPNDDIKEFTLQVKNLPTSGGALLDGVKLDNISKNVIARFDAEKIYQEYVEWAQKYDKEMVDIIGRYPEYLKSILNIEREGGKARKDIGKLSDIKDYVSYFFDELSSLDKNAILSENTEFDKVEVKNILDGFLQTYAIEDDKDLWFEKIKILCDQIGFAKTMKEYKHDPSLYKGSIVDVMNIIRLFLTGKKTGPDLFPIMNILGYEKVNDRLSI